MALNSFKTLYHAVTEEDTTTDNSLESFDHERMIYVPGNIGLIRDTDGDVIKQSWWTGGNLYPLPERNLDEIRTFVNAELVKNPDAKWGLLNLEAPHLKLINGDGSEENRTRAANAVIEIFTMLKTEYPQIKWSNYNTPYRHYGVMVNPNPKVVEGYIFEKCEKFSKLAEYMDWLAPACYDGYNYDAYLTETAKQNNRNAEIKYCKSGMLLMQYYQAYTSTSKPVIAVLYHGYRSKGKYSDISIEPDPSVTETPYPVYTEDSHAKDDRGMYLGKPIPTEEWMAEWGKISVDTKYDGIYMWHWNRGFFSYCFSTLTAPANPSDPNSVQIYNNVLYYRARIRWWMSLENDFGFTPYSAPSPTSHSSWTSGASSTEVREKMRLFFKLVMKKKMDDIQTYALGIKPPLYKPPIHDSQSILVNPVTGQIDDVTATNLTDPKIEAEGLPSEAV